MIAPNAATLDACIRASNMARDVRDTVTVLRLALRGDGFGLGKEEVEALHHVAGWCEAQAQSGVKLAGEAMAAVEGRAHG